MTSLETDYDPVWGSLVKPTVEARVSRLQRELLRLPTFAELLEDAAKEGVIQLELDQQRGNYRVAIRALTPGCRRGATRL